MKKNRAKNRALFIAKAILGILLISISRTISEIFKSNQISYFLLMLLFWATIFIFFDWRKWVGNWD